MENGQPTRRCKKCGEMKILTDFPVYDVKSGGRRHACQKCYDARVEKWHRDNVERVRAQCKERYRLNPFNRKTPEQRARTYKQQNRKNAERRGIVIQAYGGRCACCGEMEHRFLTIDHVNNDGASMRKVHGPTGSLYRWLINHKFPDGFQVLCMNCNFGKALNNGICPHETTEPSTTIPQGSTAKRPEVPRTLAAE